MSIEDSKCFSISSSSYTTDVIYNKLQPFNFTENQVQTFSVGVTEPA